MEVGRRLGGERCWSEPFFFALLADPQFGMLHSNSSWREEKEIALAAVSHINRLRPKFVVVCGDMTNALPIGRGSAPPDVVQAQVCDFKKVVQSIDPSIPIIYVCGNHDVGDRPNAETIRQYRCRYGPDYFSFWVGGCKCLILNSSLHAAQESAPVMYQTTSSDSLGPDESTTQVHTHLSECRSLAAEQDQWLCHELRQATTAQHTLVFSHIPPFVRCPSEPKGYFNYSPELRQPLLSRLKQAGVSKWFCGHYHRNAGGWYGELEVVITSASGLHLIDDADGNYLETSGLRFPATLSSAHSGMRLVTVDDKRVSHRWFTIDHVSKSMNIQNGSIIWQGLEQGVGRSRL